MTRKDKKVTVSKGYSMGMDAIQKVEDLARRSGLNSSKIVELCIEAATEEVLRDHLIRKLSASPDKVPSAPGEF